MGVYLYIKAETIVERAALASALCGVRVTENAVRGYDLHMEREVLYWEDPAAADVWYGRIHNRPDWAALHNSFGIQKLTPKMYDLISAAGLDPMVGETDDPELIRELLRGIYDMDNVRLRLLCGVAEKVYWG